MATHDQPGQQEWAITRRRFLKIGAGALAVAGATAAGVVDGAAAATVDADSALVAAGTSPQEVLASIQAAYLFQETMMDAYDQGTALRLAQSYSDQNGLFSTAFTYDNALTILAYLYQRNLNGLKRAKLLGDSLLYAQQHDPNYDDGRLRQAYNVGPYTFYDGSPQPDKFIHPDGTVNVGYQFGFTGSAVGDMAWAGMALAQLNFYTQARRYLDGAVKLGAWIFTNTYDTRTFGGYTFGVDGNNTPLLYSATEHNIDVYGFFNMLAKLTGDTVWIGRAQHALQFIQNMWNPAGGFFYTGTNADGTLNLNPIPEDAQTWSYLALLDPKYMASIDWANNNLRTTDTPQSVNSGLTGNQSFTGVTFSTASLHANPAAPIGGYGPLPDPQAVWFEGTGHIADALLQRQAVGDRDAATFYLGNIRRAQASLGQGQTVGGKPLPAGAGIVAASSALDTGYGFGYFQYLHIGATAWYLMAVQRRNPYQLERG